MPSKEQIRLKLCTDSTSPTYPVAQFDAWMKHEQNAEVLQQLTEIQQELNSDEYAWRMAAVHGNVAEEWDRVVRWCAYCTQVRMHYLNLFETSKPQQPLWLRLYRLFSDRFSK